MINNSQENNNQNSIKIKLNYNNNIYEIETKTTINASELRQNLFSKFNIDDSFILSYKNQKIRKNDSIPLLILFKEDNKPLLFINDNNTIFPTIKQNISITIKTNIPQKSLLNILNLFFQSKFLPFNASINAFMKGVYNITFNKPYLASEFLKFYISKVYKTHKNEISLDKININKNNRYSNKNEFLTNKVNKSNNNNKDFLKLRNSYNQLVKNTKRKPSISDILLENDKNLALYKVIKENSKSDNISENIISSGLYKYHQSYINTIDHTKNRIQNLKKKSEFINDKYIFDDTYEGIYSIPFMSQEEKYMRDKFLDKKNWLKKNGFIVSVGKYSMKKNNFIPNYVNATPSESPLLHKYRDVNKKKWINRIGFI